MDFIELRGGLLVRPEAVALAVALEARGHVLAATGTVLTVSNGSALTPDDRAQIRALKPQLIALATYEAPDHA